MRHFLGAAGLFISLTHPVFAFDSAECGEIESQIYTVLDAEFGWEVTQSPTSITEAGPDTCAVTDLEIHVEELGVLYTARAVHLVAPEAMDWVRGDVILPDRVMVEIRGVRLDSGFGVPEDLGWLTRVSADTITLSASWDETLQRLSIHPLGIDLGDGNTVSIAMEGQASGWQPYVMRDEDFGLISLVAEIGFNGLFEQAIAPPIEANGTLLTPESAQFLSAMAYGLLANVPTTLVPTTSQEAIVDFLATIPNPRGDLTMSLTNDAPFSPADIVEEVIGGASLLVAVPDRLSLTAEWAPAN